MVKVFRPEKCGKISSNTKASRLGGDSTEVVLLMVDRLQVCAQHCRRAV